MNWLAVTLGLAISLGSLISNIPQFHRIIKYKNVEGISEASLILMNLGMTCLTMNALIFYWNTFFYLPNAEILPFVNIALSWIMVLIYYIIFIFYKFKNYEKRIISGLNYCLTYILFLLLVIGMALAEKLQHNNGFFTIYAEILGIMSAIFNGLVYLPQIYLLLKNRNNGNLSLLTYCIQTPGNFIIIIYQAIICQASLTTWITYLVVLVEQSIILILMIMNIISFQNQEENEKFIREMTIDTEW